MPDAEWWERAMALQRAVADGPGFWMNETSGVLRPAIGRYLTHEPLSPGDIAAIRAYLRQWITKGDWRGPVVEQLRRQIDELTSREAIANWIGTATDEGLDPL